eukprot:3740167-Rhodomonas_salina.1
MPKSNVRAATISARNVAASRCLYRSALAQLQRLQLKRCWRLRAVWTSGKMILLLCPMGSMSAQPGL